MNWKDVKKIIKKEVLKEATTVNAGNTKFNLRTGVNKNPTKLGLKIQFEPLTTFLYPIILYFTVQNVAKSAISPQNA